MTEKQTVAVLGAGATMGFPMARNLAQAGLDVRAWNRSRGKADPLTDHGAQVFDTAGEAAEGAGAILTMLADADAVIDSMQSETGALSGDVAAGTLWLQMSTIGEQATERCIEIAREHELEFVDAPVLGTKQPAEEAKLVILASGADGVRDRVEPILDAIGQRTMWVGDPGNGTRLKLAVNSWLLTVVEGSAETLALAEGMGLDPQLVLDAVSGGPLDMPYLQMKGAAIIERDFDPSFRLALAAKDAKLVQAAARRRSLDLPLVDTIRERLDQGAREHGDRDLIATYLTSSTSR